MEISGKSGVVNAVLATLKFTGAPNKSSGQIEITVDDGDPFTEIVKTSYNVSIDPAPPSISTPGFSLDVKEAKASSISGIKINDIDSSTISVNMAAQNGIISGAPVKIYNFSEGFADGDVLNVSIAFSDVSKDFTISASNPPSADEIALFIKDHLTVIQIFLLQTN